MMDGGKRIILFVGGLMMVYIAALTFGDVWNALGGTGINQFVAIFPLLFGIAMIALSFINPMGSDGR